MKRHVELSILIKYYRNQKNLSQDDLVDGICSRQTLSSIETIKINSDATIYESLLNRLGLHGFEEFDDEFLFDRLDKINKLYTNYEITKANHLVDEILDMKASNIVLNEYKEVLIILKNHYATGAIIPFTECEKYLQISAMFPSSLTNLIHSFAYRCLSTSTHKIANDKLITRYHIFNGSLPTLVAQLDYYLIRRRYGDVLLLGAKHESEVLTMEYFGLARVIYEKQYQALVEIQPKNVEDFEEKISDFIIAYDEQIQKCEIDNVM